MATDLDELLFRPGQVVVLKNQGTFENQDLLGEGGYGSVHLWTRLGDYATGKAYAAKTIRQQYWADMVRMAQFTKEATKIAQLGNHPHVCEVHGLFYTVPEQGTDAPAIPVLLMSYLRGHSLRSCLAWELKPIFQYQIATQVLSGLGAIHKSGTIHRDIKAENIMLADPGDGSRQVKIIDFGIVHGVGDPFPVGRVEGTPTNMSPAQCLGETPTISDDIYAVSVMFYELFTGVRVFPDVDYADKDALLYAHVNTKPKSVLEVAPHAPEDVARMIDRGLSKNPDERPPVTAEYAIPFQRMSRYLTKTGSTETLNQMFDTPLRPPNAAGRNSTPPPGYTPGNAPETIDSPERAGSAGGTVRTVGAGAALAAGSSHYREILAQPHVSPRPDFSEPTPAPYQVTAAPPRESAPPAAAQAPRAASPPSGKTTMLLEPGGVTQTGGPPGYDATSRSAIKPTMLLDPGSHRGSVPTNRPPSVPIPSDKPTMRFGPGMGQALSASTTGPSTTSREPYGDDSVEGAPLHERGPLRRSRSAPLVGVAIGLVALGSAAALVVRPWRARAPVPAAAASALVEERASPRPAPSVLVAPLPAEPARPAPPPAPLQVVAPLVPAPAENSPVGVSGSAATGRSGGEIPVAKHGVAPAPKKATPSPARAAPAGLKDTDIFSIPKLPDNMPKAPDKSPHAKDAVEPGF